MKFLKKLFDHEYKELKRFEKIADKVIELDEEMTSLSDNDLKEITNKLKERLQNGETLEDIIVEAFAAVREAAYRVIKEKPYKVQIIGGLAIHYGNIAEMKTGEGKTLTSTMPAYLNALTGDGVHIITVNDYLANRDAEWMGEIYRFLGLSVGINGRELTFEEKKEAYSCDIMYSTNNEIGFDYLRDNMVVEANERVARKLNFAIVDEVDSVLIDEARTPLIISGGVFNGANLYIQADRFVKTLRKEDGYLYDEKTKSVVLDDIGVAKAEKAFGIDNLFDLKHTTLVHHINQSLKANFSMKKDFDYVVSDDKIVIVDAFTGRLMQGRAYSDGLHQAIEAKEGVTINEETRTLATITFQNLFRMYNKLSGMTGTAKTEEEEFREIYNMFVITIPTNRPVVREDFDDLLFATQKGKFKAIVEEIKDRNKKGQPVLVGTVAVETSELISSMLNKANIKHEVLNAKNHAREAEIISNAGKKGAVTIATNMAGRGTDIKLTDEVKDLGGLCVLGTERHESRRIDNQLRGRSGRQGDPGMTQFCVSFEDELMVRFGTDKAKSLLSNLGFDNDASIRNKMLSKSIEQAQRRVEGNNYDLRKELLKYDDVINKQRELIYSMRNEILDNENISDMVDDDFYNFSSDMVNKFTNNESKGFDVDYEKLIEILNESYLTMHLTVNKFSDCKNEKDVIDIIYETLKKNYEKKMSSVPKHICNEFEKAITLRIIDTYWMEHINSMDHLKEGVGLRGYAQEDPLRAYTTEGFNMFDNLLDTIEKEVVGYLMNSEIRQNTEREQVIKGEAVEDSSKTVKKKPKRVNKTGRNDLCSCGSGKKYKQCCGK